MAIKRKKINFNVGDYISCKNEIDGKKCVYKVIEVDKKNKGYTLYSVEGTFAHTPAPYSGLPFSESHKYALEKNYKTTKNN